MTAGAAERSRPPHYTRLFKRFSPVFLIGTIVCFIAVVLYFSKTLPAAAVISGTTLRLPLHFPAELNSTIWSPTL